jgi:hypothetical protein
MIRHIIVEGPDGAGKSTLVKRLVDTGLFCQYPRASDSTKGPVTELGEWVRKAGLDMITCAPAVFDRHPLISEPIYGPICRGAMRPMFDNVGWLHRHIADLTLCALVIWCLPPFEEVQSNVVDPTVPQMSNVAANIATIYNMYRQVAEQWPGASMYCNYTRGTTHMDHVIKTAIRLVVPRWELTD